MLWGDEKWNFDAAIVARDGDRHRDDAGARQALRDTLPQRPVAVAYAVPEIEAWIVAGFAPRDDREQARHQECCRRVSFDPLTQPERLTSTVREGDRDAKRVCAELVPDTAERYDRCLDVEEGEWRRRTAQAGGPEFLDDLTDRLVPELRKPA